MAPDKTLKTEVTLESRARRSTSETGTELQLGGKGRPSPHSYPCFDMSTPSKLETKVKHDFMREVSAFCQGYPIKGNHSSTQPTPVTVLHTTAAAAGNVNSCSVREHRAAAPVTFS
ncbi:hypothetical protein NQZ68_020808 [Dissostichus eleginoides]|nr:hypothetical protein NQZ68_020808 [Dissostichus eleginoides]